MNAEKREAQKELDDKRAKKEKQILGRGRGKGRGRGRERRSKKKALRKKNQESVLTKLLLLWRKLACRNCARHGSRRLEGGNLEMDDGVRCGVVFYIIIHVEIMHI